MIDDEIKSSGESKECSLVSREDVLYLALHDPVLANCLKFWHNGMLNFEGAMMLAVKSLIKQKDYMVKEGIEREVNRGIGKIKLNREDDDK